MGLLVTLLVVGVLVSLVAGGTASAERWHTVAVISHGIDRFVTRIQYWVLGIFGGGFLLFGAYAVGSNVLAGQTDCDTCLLIKAPSYCGAEQAPIQFAPEDLFDSRELVEWAIENGFEPQEVDSGQ